MKTKLAGRLPLQDAIAQTIEAARMKSKLASEDTEDRKGRKFATSETTEVEKTASVIDAQDPDEVEKLASALDFLATKLAGDTIENGGESRQGGQQLPTMGVVGGTQPYKKDSSKSHNVPTSTGMKSTKDNPGASTAVPTDDERAPGGNGAKYPAKGVLKTGSVARLQAALAEMTGVEKNAFDLGTARKAVTDTAGKVGTWAKGRPAALREAGQWAKGAVEKGVPMKERAQMAGFAARKAAPELGAATATLGGAELLRRRHNKKKKLEKGAAAFTDEGHEADAEKYEIRGRQSAERLRHDQKHGVSSYRNDDGSKKKGSFLKGLRGFGVGSSVVDVRRMEHAAKKHREGKNSWNPFGGVMTPSKYEGKGATRFQAGRVKEGSADPIDYILGKISAVENGGESKQGGEQLSNTAPVPSNPGRQLISSNSAPASATKREAKSPRKKELGEVLTEPAFSAAHDSKVNENLRSAAKGGVKIAAATALLRKVAAEGCQCNEAGSCRFCKMKSASVQYRTANSK